MIRLTDVRKSFNKGKSNEIKAIDNTSVELDDKGLVTFLGNSGCGKTTLLNAIGGLDKVDSGTIFINNDKITSRLSSKRDDIRNANIGYIFQNYNLIEDATVFANVALVLKMMGYKDKQVIEERVMYVLKKVGIDRYRNRPAKTLSGGERQRVGIARAIVKNPKVIIADEPTGNLDSGNTIEIMNIIKAISREKLVILVTHERDIAEFYSDRIIDIVDGKIVGDRENSHDGKLDYRIENKIYLQDMPHMTQLDSDNISIQVYSDEEPENLNIKVVVKDNNLYIDMGRKLSMGSESVELIDDHYRQISKDVYEEYEFHLDDFVDGKKSKRKYTPIFTPGRSLVDGFKKLKSFSVIKKILLIGFVLASCFVIYAVSNVAGILQVKNDQFVQVNENYLEANTGKLTMEKYNKYKNMEGVDYVLPGDSLVTFTMPLNDYFQTTQAKTSLNGSLADKKMLDDAVLLYGEKTDNPYELVINNMLAKKITKDYNASGIGIDTPEKLLGRKLTLSGLDPFVITGIADEGSPCIYANSEMLLKIIGYSNPSDETGDMDSESGGSSVPIVAYSLVENKGEISIVRGRAPVNDYEVILDENRIEDVAIGKTIDEKVNGTKLTVVGFYHDKRHGTTMYVNDSTKDYATITGMKNLMISPTDKAATFDELSGGEIRVIDRYAQDREKYVNSMKREVFTTIVMAAVMVIISLIEIYLILRASFLSRIREIGVLRAIGLKKRDIYMMFSGEIFAITTVTAIPFMGIMAYIISAATKISYIGDKFVMNPAVFITSFLIVFLFNMLAGLLPVFGTLRKSPAAILARNDVN